MSILLYDLIKVLATYNMKIRLGTLRKLIREAGGWASPPQPAGRNSFSSDLPNREQIGRLGSDKDDSVEQITSHLEDATVNPEDCYGPVPPTTEKPGVRVDPFTRDFGPASHPNIRRLWQLNRWQLWQY